MSLDEISWIEFLKRKAPTNDTIVFGIGDDCALVKINKDKILLKSDLFIEGVHFNLEKFNFRTIGIRAILRVLSDFAACGGIAKFIGVSLGKPKYVKEKELKEIIRGILHCAKKYNFYLIGGDTSQSFRLFLDVWGIGITDRFISRGSAKVGDYIFITNKLGERSFFEIFEPRIKEAQYLVKNFKVNSMIDISDGFILDLYRILKDSRKGAILFGDCIPVKNGEDDLYRGEDYELIFTIAENEPKLEVIKKKFYFVGRITEEDFGYKIKKGNTIKKVDIKGYTHF